MNANEMNVSDQIIAVLDEVCRKFGVAIDWSSTNILPYLQELGERMVSYTIVTNLVSIFATLLIGGITLFFLYRGKQKNVEALLRQKEEEALLPKESEEEQKERKNKRDTVTDDTGFYSFFSWTVLIAMLVIIFWLIGHILIAVYVPEQVVMDFLEPYITSRRSLLDLLGF